MAEAGKQPVDEGEDRRCRAVAQVDRQIEEVPPHRTGLAREPFAGGIEAPWVRALEAENRLLVVADREDGPLAARCPLAGEKFEGKGADDVPLSRVGVLRRVDEDMIGALVELEADPFAYARLDQQLFRRADKVVEI